MLGQVFIDGTFTSDLYLSLMTNKIFPSWLEMALQWIQFGSNEMVPIWTLFILR